MKAGTLTVAVIALLILAFAGGYYLGNQNGLNDGKKSAEASLLPVINTMYPKPAEDLRTLRGTVQGVYGGTISILVTDPNDYIPHADGSAQKTELRNVGTDAQTQIVSISYANAAKDGAPKITSISASALKAGMRISVFADHNIRNEQQFTATRVELIQ